MPNVEASKRDLQKLIGKKLDAKQLEEAIEFAKGEIELVEGDRIVIDEKDTNRPDLLSAEGIAREIRARIGIEKGLPKYKVRKSNVSVIVDKNMAKIRPYIAAAVIKNVKINEEMLVQIINSQEKVCGTFGRKRKEAAVGIYDWSKLKQPMHYRAYDPRVKKFIPLEYRIEMDLEEILLEHPKGKEFKHLLEGFAKFPIFEDSKKVVASMPPIINSQLTGKVAMSTKEFLVEVTGHSQETVNTALNVMVSAFGERGFDIYSVKIKYPNKTIVTPDFTPGKITVEVDEIKKISGLELSTKQIVELLKRARYDVTIKGKKLLCKYPAYRPDILHPVDVAEDAIISYGYNKIEPEPIRISTKGSELKTKKFKKACENVCVGLGLQGVLTFTMTSKEKQAEMIGFDSKKEQFVEIENPVSEKYTVFRKNVYPELLEFLGKNKHAQFPQKIFEIGKTLELDSKAETGTIEKNKLCIVFSGKGADFNVSKGVLDAIADNVGFKYSLKENKTQSGLESGKSAEIAIEGKKGFLGELSKKTMQNFGLDQQTAVLEIEI